LTGKEHFEDTEGLKKIAKDAHKIFRVSDRRRSQVPAVAFLVNVLAEALPHGIKKLVSARAVFRKACSSKSYHIVFAGRTHSR